MPISARSEIIADGRPRRFIWRASNRSFTGAVGQVSDGPILTLLAPSESLVAKHRDRLPRGTYMALATAFRTEIKQITPSNQLSYVARIELAEQGILIAGDSGFVDFKDKPKSFYRPLLKALLPLHVIQIAHHAGANAYFYNALADAKFTEQGDHAYLLLSHATDDKYRPSREFRLFVEGLRRFGTEVTLLFTAQPKRIKVDSFLDLIAPATAPAQDRGDVRISFANGRWQVDRHLVAVQ